MDRVIIKWTADHKKRAINMRKACVHPRLIASTLGRPQQGVEAFLSRTGIEFPPLKRPNLKWDKEAVSNWRRLMRMGLTREEMRYFGVAPGTETMSKKLAQELYGELVH